MCKSYLRLRQHVLRTSWHERDRAGGHRWLNCSCIVIPVLSGEAYLTRNGPPPARRNSLPHERARRPQRRRREIFHNLNLERRQVLGHDRLEGAASRMPS